MNEFTDSATCYLSDYWPSKTALLLYDASLALST